MDRGRPLGIVINPGRLHEGSRLKTCLEKCFRQNACSGTTESELSRGGRVETDRGSYLKSDSDWRSCHGLTGTWLIQVFRKTGAPRWLGMVGNGQQDVAGCKQQQQCLWMGGRGTHSDTSWSRGVTTPNAIESRCFSAWKRGSL